MINQPTFVTYNRIYFETSSYPFASIRLPFEFSVYLLMVNVRVDKSLHFPTKSTDVASILFNAHKISLFGVAR